MNPVAWGKYNSEERLLATTTSTRLARFWAGTRCIVRPFYTRPDAELHAAAVDVIDAWVFVAPAEKMSKLIERLRAALEAK